MAKTHGLPLGQQMGGAVLHFVEQGGVNIALPLGLTLQALGQVVGNGVVGQLTQFVEVRCA